MPYEGGGGLKMGKKALHNLRMAPYDELLS